MRREPPVLPADLVDRFGAAEDVFGPNLKFRKASTLVGLMLVVLGFAFLMFGMSMIQPNVPRPHESSLYIYLGCGLMACGSAAVILPRRVPPTWVVVCSWGLMRVRGTNWEGVAWSEVARFENADLAGATATIRQCRIVLKDGSEWGFLADYVAEYRRLCEVLSRGMAERARRDVADPGTGR